MPLLLGQLVYTSFSEVGFRVLTSTQVPKQIQQAFIQQVVHQYWDAYNPPKPGYRAAYLHQVTPEHNLFGWLYNDGLDDLGRDHVPYFICYYLAEQLQAVHLEDIFARLHWGPLAFIDRHNPPVVLETIVVPDALNYRPVNVGVAIPSGVRERSQFALKQKKLLDIFVPLNEPGTVTERNEQSDKQQEEDNSIHLKSVPPAGKKSQITRTALLVGVSDYGTGLGSLPGVLKNVTAIQQVLQDPEIGGFTEVKTLLNPDPQTIAEALETLFAERQKDDLVLLYFAGRGLQDDYGKLYLASSSKNQQFSAIPAKFVQEVMNESRAQHQLLILDCCWSSTLSADDSWWVDISGQLQGAGRVILTATTSTSCYFQDNTSGLSVYTRYLVEGLATGAADLDQDGAILVAELHDYSQRKVQAVTPLMQPQMYGIDEQQVILARAAIDAPLFQYRQAAEGYTERGKFSLVGRSVLDVLRESLEIEAEAAAAIEAQVLQPGREYQIKLQRYVQELVEAMRVSGGWSEVVLRRCQQQQRLLGLRESDVAALTEQIAGELNVLQAQHSSVSSSSAIGTEVPTVIFPPRTSANGNALNITHHHPVLSHKNFWLLVGVGIGMSLTAVVGVMSAYIQLNEIRNLKIEAKYEECSAKAEIKSWAAETFLYKDVQGLLNECRLQQAKMLAADDKFSAAIRTAKKIPKNNLLYPQAQQLIQEWSEI